MAAASGVRRDVGLAVAVCLVTWLTFAPFARLGVDAHHDGIMLKPALDVWRGQTLFRDSFCQYGALTPYLHALGLALFGPRLLAIRLVTVFLYGLAAAVLVLCWGAFLPRALVLLTFALWVLRAPFLVGPPMLPWSSVPALLFQSLALLAVVTAIETGSSASAVLSGVAAGFAFLARQPVGAVTAAAVTASLLLPAVTRPARIRQVFACLGGLGVVLGGFAGTLVWSGAVAAWLDQTVLWPRRWLGSGVADPTSLLPFRGEAARVFAFGLVAIVVLRLLRDRGVLAASAAIALALVIGHASRDVYFIAGTTGALVLGLFGALAAAVARVLRDGARDDRQIALVAASLVGVAAWLQMYPRTDYHHPFWALAPGLGLVVHAAWEASGRRTVLVGVLITAIFAGAVTRTVASARARLAAPGVTLTAPDVLAGMRVDPDQARDWQRLGEAISRYAGARPGVSVLLEGADALYAALGPRSENPGPFFVVWPGLDTVGIEERVRLIARDMPLVFRQGNARPAVQRAMDQAAYEVLVTVPAGTMLGAPIRR